MSAAAKRGFIALRKLLMDVAVEMSANSLGNCGELSWTTGRCSFSGVGFLRRRKNDALCFRAGRCTPSSRRGGCTGRLGIAEVVEMVEAVSEWKDVGGPVAGLEGE